jgi:hypothetical protein
MSYDVAVGPEEPVRETEPGGWANDRRVAPPRVDTPVAVAFELWSRGSNDGGMDEMRYPILYCRSTEHERPLIAGG